jgi:hypothetical protein
VILRSVGTRIAHVPLGQRSTDKVLLESLSVAIKLKRGPRNLERQLSDTAVA